MSFIYIMTNPAYPGYVKIGATNRPVEERRVELSGQTGVMFDFETYATYETPTDLTTEGKGKLKDTKLHHLIDKLNPTLRANQKREFYKMTPEEALDLLTAIAEIAGNVDKIVKYAEDDVTDGSKARRSPFSFKSAQIPFGSELTFTENDEIKATVYNDRQVEYNGKVTSVSDLARTLLDLNHPVQGTLYFMYEGETLSDRRRRMEESGDYK